MTGGHRSLQTAMVVALILVFVPATIIAQASRKSLESFLNGIGAGVPSKEKFETFLHNNEDVNVSLSSFGRADDIAMFHKRLQSIQFVNHTLVLKSTENSLTFVASEYSRKAEYLKFSADVSSKVADFAITREKRGRTLNSIKRQDRGLYVIRNRLLLNDTFQLHNGLPLGKMIRDIANEIFRLLSVPIEGVVCFNLKYPDVACEDNLQAVGAITIEGSSEEPSHFTIRSSTGLIIRITKHTKLLLRPDLTNFAAPDHVDTEFTAIKVSSQQMKLRHSFHLR